MSASKADAAGRNTNYASFFEPEEMDPHNNEFLGNTPLIFSLVEYIRALMEIDKSRTLSKAALMMGQLKNKAERFIDS